MAKELMLEDLLDSREKLIRLQAETIAQFLSRKTYTLEEIRQMKMADLEKHPDNLVRRLTELVLTDLAQLR